MKRKTISKIKKKSTSNSNNKLKLLKYIFILIVLPILCTTLYESGKALYLKRYPLVCFPTSLSIDSDISSRYLIVIRNRSDASLGPTWLHIAFDNIDVNATDYVTLRPRQVKQNSIIPFLDDTIGLVVSNKGKLQYNVIEDKIDPGERLEFVIEFSKMTYTNKLHLKSNVEFGYSLNKLHLSYGGNKEVHRKKEGEAEITFDTKKLTPGGPPISPERE